MKGCAEGWFTGKKLADYPDYRNMRRVVNGTDRADTIAGYAVAFERALHAMGAQEAASPIPSPSTTNPLGPLARLFAAILAIFTKGR